MKLAREGVVNRRLRLGENLATDVQTSEGKRQHIQYYFSQGSTSEYLRFNCKNIMYCTKTRYNCMAIHLYTGVIHRPRFVASFPGDFYKTDNSRCLH